MSREKLRRELNFVEDSFKAGILTREEYLIAKTRIDAKIRELDAAPKEEPGRRPSAFSLPEKEEKAVRPTAEELLEESGKNLPKEEAKGKRPSESPMLSRQKKSPSATESAFSRPERMGPEQREVLRPERKEPIRNIPIPPKLEPYYDESRQKRREKETETKPQSQPLPAPKPEQKDALNELPREKTPLYSYAKKLPKEPSASPPSRPPSSSFPSARERLLRSPHLITITLLLVFILALFLFLRLPSPESEFVPVCSADLECQRSGLVGSCSLPGTRNASCLFQPASPVGITIIGADCPLCDAQRMQNTLTQIFPGASFERVPLSAVSEELIAEYGLEALPAYVLGEEVEQARRFNITRSALRKVGEGYVMSPESSGASYFFGNDARPGTVELFMNPSQEPSLKALGNVLTLASTHVLSLRITFQDVEESQDILRQACVKEASSIKFDKVLSCMQKRNAVFEDCLESYAISVPLVQACLDDAPESLLEQDRERARAFSINTAPVFVFNNQFKKGGSLSPELLEQAFCAVNDC